MGPVKRLAMTEIIVLSFKIMVLLQFAKLNCPILDHSSKPYCYSMPIMTIYIPWYIIQGDIAMSIVSHLFMSQVPLNLHSEKRQITT
jgi:hypothetical protein